MRLLFIGTLFAFALFFATSCSYDDDGYDDGGNPPASDPEWTDVIKPILADSCALSGCHANAAFVNSGAAFKASKSNIRIGNNTMPVPGSKGAQAFSADDRTKVLAYLNN
jgi:hypothetical protein